MALLFVILCYGSEEIRNDVQWRNRRNVRLIFENNNYVMNLSFVLCYPLIRLRSECFSRNKIGNSVAYSYLLLFSSRLSILETYSTTIKNLFIQKKQVFKKVSNFDGWNVFVSLC